MRLSRQRKGEQAQSRLAHQEQQARAEADRRVRELEAIFEAMGDGLVVSDLQGQVQMNAAAHHLLPMAFAQGSLQGTFEQQDNEPRVWDEDGQPLDPEHWPIHRVLRGEHLTSARAVNIQRLNAQGEMRDLNISGMPIYDQQQSISGAVLVFRDMTERTLLERRTQELNRRFADHAGQFQLHSLHLTLIWHEKNLVEELLMR
jgi:PAS domain-containing protein